MRNRRVVVLILSLVLVAVLTAGCVGRGQLLQKALEGSLAGADAVYTVANKDVASGTAVSGTIHALRTTTLVAQAQGRVDQILKQEGDAVKGGDVILRIESATQDNLLAQAESRYRAASVNRQVAELTDMAVTKAQLESALAQATAQRSSAEANLSNFTDKDTSASQLGNLQEQVKQAEASLRSAQNNLKSLQDYDTSELQVTIADFSVQQAELNLSMAQTRLSVLETGVVTDAQYTQLREQVVQAEAGLRIAELRLQESADNANASDETIATLEEQVRQAESSLRIAQSNRDHADETYGASASDIDLQRMSAESSRVSLLNAESNYRIAVAQAGQKKLSIASAQEQVNQAQSSLTIARNNLDATMKTNAARSTDESVLKAQLAQAQAGLAVAQRNVDGFADTERKNNLQVDATREQELQAKLALGQQRLTSDNYTVKAPYDGVVILVNVKEDDYATPQMTLAKVASTTGINVETFVDEIDILNVKQGQDASISIDPYPDATFAGTVSYVGRAQVRTPEGLNAYSVRIALLNPPASIVDGMSADATIILSVARGVLAVPVESIIGEDGKKYVMLVSTSANGKVTTVKTEVTTGVEGEDYVEVKTGLSAGDQIQRQPAIATSTTGTSDSPFMGGS
jgi:RND family efflux transporter MFP subunit